MVTLYQGDCLELMKDIPDKSVDMILCDLPFGVTQNTWDNCIDFNSLWELYNRIVKKMEQWFYIPNNHSHQN